MRFPDKLTYADIEERALSLLIEFGGGTIPSLPIPIQKIMESYLDLELLFGDPVDYGLSSNVLGAIYFDERLVLVNKYLSEDDSLEGRLNFTLGHETGHAKLHYGVVDPMVYIRPRFLNQRSMGRHILCRLGDHSPIEKQADIYSACILMPRLHMQEAVKQVAEEQGTWLEANRYIYSATDEKRFVGALADRFCVSKSAMKRRLKELDLAVGGSPGQLRWF